MYYIEEPVIVINSYVVYILAVGVVITFMAHLFAKGVVHGDVINQRLERRRSRVTAEDERCLYNRATYEDSREDESASRIRE